MNEIANNAGLGALRDDDGEALERRLLRSVFVLVAVAVLVSLVFAPWRVTTGLLLGGTLSLLNHHWLRVSLRAVFGEGVGGGGARPRLGAARYVLRYFLIALVVAAAYRLDLVSIGATLAGLCSFAAAVMVEAFMQLYFAIVYREES